MIPATNSQNSSESRKHSRRRWLCFVLSGARDSHRSTRPLKKQDIHRRDIPGANLTQGLGPGGHLGSLGLGGPNLNLVHWTVKRGAQLAKGETKFDRFPAISLPNEGTTPNVNCSERQLNGHELCVVLLPSFLSRFPQPPRPRVAIGVRVAR